ncbi:MAG TPA: hypothetical protein VM093_10140 [Aeromicrobium sp.]|nr:hypothetical protein [Aeromicrobium sp.]
MNSLPDPHVLDAEANMLRQQAAALHKAGNDAIQRDVATARDWHQRHDPERAAEAKQAETEHAESKVWSADAERNRKMAEASDKTAQTAEAKGLISDAEEAREAAQRQRALADQESATADQLESSAVSHDAHVRQLNADEDTIWVKESNAIEKVADQIDDKVRFLSEAAQKQREADAMRARGDESGASEAERAAGYFIQQADTRQIDVSAISPAILEAAGVQEDVLNRPPEDRAADPMDTPQGPPDNAPSHPEDVPPAQVADADDATDQGDVADQDDLDATTAMTDSTSVAQADTTMDGADTGTEDPFAAADPDPGSAEYGDDYGGEAPPVVAESDFDFSSDSEVADYESTVPPEADTESLESDSLA